ncbi:hypothetical protein ABKN59_004288 [Abortiporus biennis]
MPEYPSTIHSSSPDSMEDSVQESTGSNESVDLSMQKQASGDSNNTNSDIKYSQESNADVSGSTTERLLLIKKLKARVIPLRYDSQLGWVPDDGTDLSSVQGDEKTRDEGKDSKVDHRMDRHATEEFYEYYNGSGQKEDLEEMDSDEEIAILQEEYELAEDQGDLSEDEICTPIKKLKVVQGRSRQTAKKNSLVRAKAESDIYEGNESDPKPQKLVKICTPKNNNGDSSTSRKYSNMYLNMVLRKDLMICDDNKQAKKKPIDCQSISVTSRDIHSEGSKSDPPMPYPSTEE